MSQARKFQVFAAVAVATLVGLVALQIVNDHATWGGLLDRVAQFNVVIVAVIGASVAKYVTQRYQHSEWLRTQAVPVAQSYVKETQVMIAGVEELGTMIKQLGKNDSRVIEKMNGFLHVHDVYYEWESKLLLLVGPALEGKVTELNIALFNAYLALFKDDLKHDGVTYDEWKQQGDQAWKRVLKALQIWIADE